MQRLITQFYFEGVLLVLVLAVENMTKNLLFIGTVNAPAPIYHNNDLKNFTSFQTHSYEYYRTYPYRASQWWLDE